MKILAKKGGYGEGNECKEATTSALRKAATHREKGNGLPAKEDPEGQHKETK